MDAEKSDNSSFEDLSNFKDMPEIEDIEKPEPAVKAETAEPSSTTNSNETTGNEPDTKDKDEDTIDVLGNGQLVKRVISKSKLDKRPIRGDLVTIKYTGKLDDGTVVEQADNAKLHVGDFEVVQGLDMTVPLMNVGEVAEVKINSRFAYGALGLKKDDNPLTSIPPNATLTYDVELLDAKSEDFSDLKAFEIRRRYGTQKKERANFWYNRGEYNTAIQLYRRALEYLDDRDGDPDSEFDKEDLGYSNSDLQQLLDDRLIVYNNLAMAQIKILAYDAALKSVEHVLLCQPNNAKALYRKGRILDAKCDTKGAIALLQKAATLEPENRIIQQDLAKLMIKQRREENNEKEMYQKMLGQAKKLEQKNKQPKQQTNVDNSKLKLFCYILGSVLIGVAGAAIYRYKY